MRSVTDNRKQRASERVAARNAARTARANEVMGQGPAEELDPGIAALRERRRAKAEKAAEKYTTSQGHVIDGVPHPHLRITGPARSQPEPEEPEVEEEDGAARKPRARAKKKATKRR
jgi:hypothetical protein